MAAKAFKVRCTQCSKLLQFVPRSAESQLTCPQCGRTMRVKTPQAAVPRTAPTRQPSPVRPGAATQQRSATRQGNTTRPASAARPGSVRQAVPSARPPQRPRNTAPAPAPASEIDWMGLPSAPAPTTSFTPQYASAPAAGAFVGGGAVGVAPGGSFAAPRPPARKRSGGMGTATKVLLTIGAVFVGGGVLLALGLVALVMLAGAAGPQSKSTMTLAGWSVDAPGVPAGDKQEARAHSKGILHRTTNSEFSIATKQVALGGQSFTIDQVFNSMKASNRITDDRPTSRGGMEGFRFTMPAPGNGANSTVELFKLNGSSVLLLIYIPGPEKERVGLGRARFDEEKTREYDDPEAFFASLRRG